MRISDWSSDVCSSDLPENVQIGRSPQQLQEALRLGVEIDVEQDVHVGAGALAQGFYVVAQVAHMAALDIEVRLEGRGKPRRSEEHTSELQSLMRISYAVFCLKKKNRHNTKRIQTPI